MLTSAVPYASHGEPGVTATHIMTYALLQALRARGHDVVVQCLFDQSRTPDHLTPADENALATLRTDGVDVLDPLFLRRHIHPTTQRFRSLRLLCQPSFALDHFYPGTALHAVVQNIVDGVHPDVLLPVWSPQSVAATHRIRGVARVAYHGDIDYAPMKAKFIDDPELFHDNNVSFLSSLDRRARTFAYARAHWRLMRSLDAIANITASNRMFYAKHGHPRSMYVRNTWIDEGNPPAPIAASPGRPVKIIGHVGYLNRTGSTYGLRFLLRDVLPRLKQEMGGKPYEVHVIGGGEPFPEIRRLLGQEHVVRHGFVPDLDAELESSDVFCLFNNAGPYLAAYTRHLVAWSRGLCLVTHVRSTLAIPEIIHEKNALVADDAASAAALIARAASDLKLQQRIRLGGRRTFTEGFTPAHVAAELESVLLEAVAARQTASSGAPASL